GSTVRGGFDDGEVGRGWNEVWSERSSGEPNDDGPCPADKNSTFSDTVVLGS
ncbi:hypothetical protein A2U01_0066221, partial [Trifolium medium]|nr:hypothetical protein [Trifolium medium]